MPNESPKVTKMHSGKSLGASLHLDGQELRGRVHTERPHARDVPSSEVSGTATRRHLRLAKALAFSSGAGMVAWNKFASLWLLSIGVTPAQTGTLKSVGLIAKALAQPLWAALVDMRVFGLVHPSLGVVSNHLAAICSTVFSLITMEILRRFGPTVSFLHILLLRTIWAFANSGGMLVDAMVVQMSHGTDEGYGKQRLWGSISWGCMSLLAGILIDLRGLDFLFTYTWIARTVLMLVVVVAIAETLRVNSGGQDDDKFSGDEEEDDTTVPQGRIEDEHAEIRQHDVGGAMEYVKRLRSLITQQPIVGILLAANLVQGVVFVICEHIVSIQMDRDFALSKTVNGLTNTLAIVTIVPCFYYSSALIHRIGHWGMIIGAQCLLVLLLLCYSIVSKGTWWVLLLLPALKGAVQTLVWVASVDLMQECVDPKLANTCQTLLTWAHFTVGGGIGYPLWSWVYQNYGAGRTYVLGAWVVAASIGALRHVLAEHYRRGVTTARVDGAPTPEVLPYSHSLLERLVALLAPQPRGARGRAYELLEAGREVQRGETQL